jgi:hypothetical protein
MKVTISFGTPFLVIIYTVSILMTGWAIGAHWGHTLTSGWMLFLATILLSCHDTCIAILFAMAANKIMAARKSEETGTARTTAESSERSREPRTLPVDSRKLYESGAHQNRRSSQEWLDLPIEELDCSVRTYNRLKNADIQTVSELVECSEDDLIEAGFMPEAINEIKETLDGVGLELRLDFDHSQEEEDE